MSSGTAIGFYGKLPCKGDFLQRRAPQEFVDAWDEWLQACIHASRQALQQQWLDVYLTGPVWRFAFAEGVCGTGAYAGLMAPSVDRVGRYFPLTIVAQWNVEESPLEVACGSQAWLDAAEALALSALESNDLDVEAFDDQVAALAQHIDAAAGAESAHLRGLIERSAFPYQPAQWHVPLSSSHAASRAMTAFAYRELQRTLRPVALWWTEGSNTVGPSWLATRGLPHPQSFVAMLSGQWMDSGWTSLGSGLLTPARPAAAAASVHPPAAPPLVEIDAPEPVVQITTCHEPVSREWGASPPNAHFVERPDVGLWGVAASDGASSRQQEATQAVADVLANVAHAGTLTSLVEQVRRMLGEVQRYRSGGSPPGEPPCTTRAIIFLARGKECALVCSGDVQAVRYRSTAATPVVGLADPLDEFVAPAYSPPAQDSGGLMDLLAAPPAKSDTDIIVRYDSLHAGDAWLIAGAPLFEFPQLPALATALANGADGTSSALSAVRAACRSDLLGANRVFPVLLLAARHSMQA